MMTKTLEILAQQISIGPLPNVAAEESRIDDIFTLVIGIFAAVALLMIVIGGINYILSGGDPSKAGRAKNTIIYALVGLVIAMSAYAIVAFVIGAA